MKKPCNEAGWLASLFGYVQHDYREVSRTTYPGRAVQAWEVATIYHPDLETQGRLQQAYIHKKLHGVTEIRMRCTRCEDEYTAETVGKTVTPTPPSPE